METLIKRHYLSTSTATPTARRQPNGEALSLQALLIDTSALTAKDLRASDGLSGAKILRKARQPSISRLHLNEAETPQNGNIDQATLSFHINCNPDSKAAT
ncbi:hypothetical protein CEXT_299541 [Caerostris extrusa]|uniref:Uncharacterized protein n=1 Tax=Caerostris extrusa TaxID=172846 RepID=A0AAV4S8U7_CAEEX|nr:hypothetical protein CEXT_299541 [Caerostris extrusa]